MESEVWLLYSQEPATVSYPEPVQSSTCPNTRFFKVHFTVIAISIPGTLFFLLISGFREV